MTQTTNKNAPAARTGRGEANNQQAAGIFAFNDTRNSNEVQLVLWPLNAAIRAGNTDRARRAIERTVFNGQF